MASDDLQEPLQPLPPMLNHIIAEPVREHLPRQWRDRHPRALPLENIAEVLEIGVSAAHDRMLELEGWDVGSAHDLVGGVHVSRGAVCLGVSDLNLKKVLRRPVDLLEGLLTRFRNGLHCDLTALSLSFSIYRSHTRPSLLSALFVGLDVMSCRLSVAPGEGGADN